MARKKTNPQGSAHQFDHHQNREGPLRVPLPKASPHSPDQLPTTSVEASVNESSEEFSTQPSLPSPNQGDLLADSAEPGRYTYPGLDKVFHEKTRLGILTCLATHPEGLLFGELKELCHLTDGNLSRHLQRLADENCVQIWKGFKRNRPQTLCRLTDEGRDRFLEYLAYLENIVSDALTAAQGGLSDAPSGSADQPSAALRGHQGWYPA